MRFRDLQYLTVLAYNLAGNRLEAEGFREFERLSDGFHGTNREARIKFMERIGEQGVLRICPKEDFWVYVPQQVGESYGGRIGEARTGNPISYGIVGVYDMRDNSQIRRMTSTTVDLSTSIARREKEPRRKPAMRSIRRGKKKR